MSSKNIIPTITQSAFDSIKPALRAELDAWCQQECQDFDAQVLGTAATTPVTAATASVWGGLPEIDSKAVVKASPIIKKYLGIDLDPKLIRRGGYSSSSELASDLLPKLRAKCPVGPNGPPKAQAAQKELFNVQ